MTLFAVQYHYDQRSDLQDEVRPSHRDYLRDLAGRGALHGSGPYTDGAPGALLIFEAANRAELDVLLAADPFALAGVIERTEVRQWALLIGPWAS